MRSKDHLVPLELREMPDKWKRNNRKPVWLRIWCPPSPPHLFFLSLSYTHGHTHKHTKEELSSLDHISFAIVQPEGSCLFGEGTEVSHAWHSCAFIWWSILNIVALCLKARTGIKSGSHIMAQSSAGQIDLTCYSISFLYCRWLGGKTWKEQMWERKTKDETTRENGDTWASELSFLLPGSINAQSAH